MSEPIKVVTGLVRFSYLNVFAPKSINGGDAKYSVCLLIPKSDKKTVKLLRDAIELAKEQGRKETWGGRIPANLKTPLRDGDLERAEDYPEYKGMYFLNATSKQKPKVVDENVQEIFDQEEIWSGCWGRASINIYSFDKSGNRGIACGLNHIQKLRDGERLGGGRSSAEDDFAEPLDLDDDELMNF